MAGMATQLGEDLWVVDTLYQGEPGVIASYLLTGPSGLSLVDVGSAASIEHLVAGIIDAGYDPAEVRHLLLTHIHLDHSGAAGRLVRLMPRARVYVHRLGAPHLVDPSKLLASASRIYGEAMERLWGTVEPVPADRITILESGDEVVAGARRLEVLYTPGHAVHHLSFVDPGRQELFAGDAAGVRLQGMSFVRPPTPPPDLSLVDWFASIDALLALGIRRLYLAHFGPIDDVETHLRQLRECLQAWGELLLPAIRAGSPDAELAELLRNASEPELLRSIQRPDDERSEVLRRYELAANYLMSAQGYVRYFHKVAPERLRD
jgi:glyoxylase-like metal-dependent hydrolase (beta-lactamase superfamily II)